MISIIQTECTQQNKLILKRNNKKKPFLTKFLSWNLSSSQVAAKNKNNKENFTVTGAFPHCWATELAFRTQIEKMTAQIGPNKEQKPLRVHKSLFRPRHK